MECSGKLLKMKAELDNPVHYEMIVGEHEISLNEHLGKEIHLVYHHEINCILCNRKTNKSFFQGMCYPCFQNAPQAEECVLRPELCRAHEGVARDMGYAHQNCLNEHFVYLSYTGDIKVGVTRKSQIPTRWIDQGATRAIKFASTPNRYLAGQIEVFMKNLLADKTNWRKMLTLKETGIDLIDEKQKLMQQVTNDFEEYVLHEDEMVEISYPLISIPGKVKSIGFDKEPDIRGVLTGIKGQYIILNDKEVLNIRKHAGYKVTLTL